MCGFSKSVTPSLFANVTYAENANFIQNWISLGGFLNYQSDPLFNYLEKLPQSPSKQSLWKAYKSAAVSSSINETQQYMQLHTCDEKDGWKSILGKCYKVVTQRKNWEDAKKHCKDLNGKLAEPQNRYISDLLHGYLQSIEDQSPYRVPNFIYNKDKFAFIGVNDKNLEGKFVFDSNNNEVQFRYWSDTEEPNNFDGKEHCIHISTNYPNGAWNDYDCDFKMWSICEL